MIITDLTIKNIEGAPDCIYYISGREYLKIINENKSLKERLRLLENALIKDKFNFSKPQVLTYKVEILQSRIKKALNMIYKNYGLLDKYQIEILEDILKGN